ncbi:YihY/virulence factor BrkB family protein [Arenibacterium sp. CAU 1754]
MMNALRLALWSVPAALLKAMRRFNSDNGWIMSSHVAMSMMLALFPFILFVVALAGALSRDVDVNELIEVVFGVWPDEIAAPIIEEIRAVLEADSLQLMTVGGVLAVYFASNGVDAVRLAISRAYRESDPRPFWKTRGLAILFVLFGGAALILGVTIGLGLPAYFRFVAAAMPDALLTWTESVGLQTVVTLGTLTLAVAACHIFLPGLRYSLSVIWPGVVLTVVLWIGAVWGFSYYVAYFADYSATYAGLAGAMAALIFLYLMAAILILGAEFNGALMRDRAARTG